MRQNLLLWMWVVVCQSYRWLANTNLRCNSSSSAAVFDVSIASPESVFLTLSVNDVLESTVNKHRSTSLSLCELNSGRQVNCCWRKKKRFVNKMIWNCSTKFIKCWLAQSKFARFFCLLFSSQISFNFQLFRVKRFMAMRSFFDDGLIEISVNSTATLVLGRVVNASPVNFFVASLLTNEDETVVLQLSFSLLTDHVFNLWWL